MYASPINTDFLDHRCLETANNVDFDVYWCDRQLSQMTIFYNVIMFECEGNTHVKKNEELSFLLERQFSIRKPRC